MCSIWRPGFVMYIESSKASRGLERSISLRPLRRKTLIILYQYTSFQFHRCFPSMILEFTDLLLSSKDLFHPIFAVIFLWLKSGRRNCCSFHMSPKSSFPKSKAHVSCPPLIVTGTLSFLNVYLISTPFTGSRHDEDEIEE